MDGSFDADFVRLLEKYKQNPPTKETLERVFRQAESSLGGTRIPNLNEWGSLLNEVSPPTDGKTINVLNETIEMDLKLLNLSTIVIGLDTRNGNPELRDNGKNVNQLQASNCMSVTKYDEFHWLLLSSNKLMTGIDMMMTNKERINDNVNTNDDVAVTTRDETKTNVNEKNNSDNLDRLIENMTEYVDLEENGDELKKEDLISVWDVLEMIMFGNENENENEYKNLRYWVLRLAIFLHCKSSNLLNLSFVKNYIKNSGGATGSDQVTQLKEKLDFVLKPLMLKLGSFVDIYESLVETQVSSGNNSRNVGILSKFVSCYHYFSDEKEKEKEKKKGGKERKEHFLFLMKYKEEDKTLMSMVSETGDKNLYDSISKFTLSTAVIDDLLMKYSDYINDMFSRMRSEMNEDEKRFLLSRCYRCEMNDDPDLTRTQWIHDVIFILENRFLTNKSEYKLPYSSEMNYQIIKQLSLAKYRKTLKKALGVLYDEIKLVKPRRSGDLEFDFQFREYFLRLSDKKNVKIQVSQFFTIIFLQIAVFHNMRWAIWECDHGGRKEKYSETVSDIHKYHKLNLIDLRITGYYGCSLFHVATACKYPEILDSFLQIDDNVSEYKNKTGKTAIDEAIKYGEWSIMKKLSLAKMGSRMKDKAKKEENKIETTRGIVSSFLKQRKNILDKNNEQVMPEHKTDEKTDQENGNHDKDKDGKDGKDAFMEELLLTMNELISNKKPICDSMLLLCWKYETSRMKKSKDGKENRLWKVLENTIRNVLDQGTSNRLNWVWFKKFILHSPIWYEMNGNDTSYSQVKKGEDGNNGENVSNKQDRQWQFKVECDCGEDVEISNVDKSYPNSNDTRHCNDCNSIVWHVSGYYQIYHSRKVYFYHCPRGMSEDHPKGFELCAKCANKRFEAWKKAKKTEKKKMALKKSINNDESRLVVTKNSQKKGILYGNLVSMADKKLLEYKKILKKEIDSLSENRSWIKMRKFEQRKSDRLEYDGVINLRQDNGDYVTYPNKLGFNEQKLEKLKLKDFYDSRVYLSNLMLVAHAMDDKFHDIMKNDILRKDFHVDYQRGPLKRIQRCQAKAESDYADRPYPNSAQILDIVRCMCVYEKSSDLLNGIETLIDRVKSQDTPFVRILRIKNL